MSDLLHELIAAAADRDPDALGLESKAGRLRYGELESRVQRIAEGLVGTGISRGQRVGVWLDKRIETVLAMMGASRAGAIFVPINPVLKEAQVMHIMRDCDVSLLVTSAERFSRLAETISSLAALHTVVLVDAPDGEALSPSSCACLPWRAIENDRRGNCHRHIDCDIASILYTSGSTGRPKGVVLTHRNMVAGAKSVATYLSNQGDDRLLSLLPLSFDAGFSQLSTAFYAGASVFLLNYLLPHDVPKMVAEERITGIGAVPPIWIPLARLDWPERAHSHLRYITNTGGAMPRRTLDALREKLPSCRVFLMYGLTEAFRSTYLPPEELERRPDSIGKAIPNAEILVVRPDGSECDPNEPGELVHRGALVAQGYWNDREKTAERFRPAPGQVEGRVHAELAVWSGDSVRRDEEGFLYFISRGDEMIKTSGYRVSPNEIEEALYASTLVIEAAAVGIPDLELGHSIAAFVVPSSSGQIDAAQLLAYCREVLPAFMVPGRIELRDTLPRNPNGKIDRAGLRARLIARDGEPVSDHS